jgi:hypothetical protein
MHPRSLLPVAAVALLAVGCGSSGSHSKGLQNFATAAYKYAACMRNHGVNMPDPVVINNATQHMIHQEIPAGMEHSPQFATAKKACRGILPAPGPNNHVGESPAQQRFREMHLLAFARCMRAHGVTSFPDPTVQGRLTLEMLAEAHVDIHTAGTKRAIVACAPSSGGIVTPAVVNQAENSTS